MKMAETSKLDLESDSISNPCEVCGLDEMGDFDKISISDHINGFKYSTEKSDSFVVDLESFSHGIDSDLPANSRISLQRGFARKGSQRGGERKANFGATANDRDAIGSAKGNIGEKPALLTMGTTDHPVSPQVHHQITVTAANIGASPAAESMRVLKRCGSRRSRPSWAFDPRRILIFFATLSSMGTLLLIYFTLTMGKLREDGETLNW